jgi:hypothetical protein
MNDLAGMMPPNASPPISEGESAAAGAGSSGAPRAAPIGAGHSHSAVELFEAGFGHFMVPVRPHGKDPGRFGADGQWRGVSSVTAFCASRDEAIEWDKEGASVGVRGGDEFLWIDNDFGEYFTKLVQKHFGVVCLRRFVDSTKHHRDAFLFRVSGKTKTLSLKFRDPVRGTEGDFGLRGSGQQAVITGIHPSRKRYLTSVKIDRIEVIPEVSPQVFARAFEAIIDEAKASGLEITQALPGSGTVTQAIQRGLGLGMTAQTQAATGQTGANMSLAHDLLDPAEVRQLLAFTPNDPTKWSKALEDYLSAYQNWVSVCFAVIGATGGSSEGRLIFIEWSDQQAQAKTTSSDLWDACIRSAQTSGVRVGGTFLVELAQKFAWDAYHKASAQTFADHPIADDQPDTPERHSFDAPTWADRLAAMNARFAFVEDRLDGVLDLKGTLLRPFRMIPFQTFYRWFEKRPEPGKAKLTLAQRWFRDRGSRTHTTAGLYPIGQEPPGALNLWTGLATKPKEGTWPTLKDYLLNVLCACDQGDYEYLRDLLFWKVQNPTERTEVAILLLGVAGSGKTTFAEKILADIFGRRFLVHHTSPQAAQSGRNDELENRAIVFFDECFFGHDLKSKGRVKSLITSPTTMVEPKFVGQYEAKNSLMVVFSSNETAALPIDKDDRRILVLEVARTHAKDRAWFQALRDKLDAGELAAFVYDALAADLSGFDRTAVPRTAARAALAAATASPEDDFVHHTLEAGSLPHGSWQSSQNAANPNNPWLSGRVAVPTNIFLDAYLEFMGRRHKGRHTRPKEEVWERFRYALGDAVHPLAKRERKPGGGRGGERFYCYVFEGLDNCRAAYDQHSGRTGDWPDAPGSRTATPSFRVATLHGRFVSEADARAAADFAKAPPFTL